jgi:hypothetical protein
VPLFFSPLEGAFVRLCGRSPKDGDPLHPTEIYRQYLREFEALLQDGYENTPNTQFIAFSRVNWMKVYSCLMQACVLFIYYYFFTLSFLACFCC